MTNRVAVSMRWKSSSRRTF